MYCKKCGTEADKEDRYCANCGAELAWEKDAEEVRKKGFPLLLIIFPLILIAVIVAVLVVLHVSGSREREYGEQLALAERYLDELDYDRAIAAYKAAIDIDPENPEAYLALADTYIEIGDYESARKILEKGLRHMDDEELEDKLSEVEEKIKGIEEAEKEAVTEKPVYKQYDGEVISRVLEGSYADWREAYVDYIKKNDYLLNVRTEYDYGGYFSYSLIYLDDNDIPELFISGDCEASGELLITFYNGRISEYHMSRIGSQYIENSGLICSNNGHSDVYPFVIAQLREGSFIRVASGVSMVEWDENGNSTAQYEFEGESVTEEEYENRIREIFDYEQASYPNHPFDYDEMIAYIETGDCLSRGHRYEFFESAVDWYEAQRLCEQKGGYLATITSPVEMDRISAQIREAGKADILFFVGYRSCEWVGDVFYSFRWINKDGSSRDADTMMPYRYSHDIEGLESGKAGVVGFISDANDMVFLETSDNCDGYTRKGYICEYDR